jgi:hypothetical protein
MLLGPCHTVALGSASACHLFSHANRCGAKQTLDPQVCTTTLWYLQVLWSGPQRCLSKHTRLDNGQLEGLLWRSGGVVVV